MTIKHLFIILVSCSSWAQNKEFPATKADSIVNQILLPVFPQFEVNVKNLGAKGDSTTNNKPFFDKAMASCRKNNGGTITVPKGTYLLNGPIHFVSNVELKLEKGAKIKFSDNPQHYLPLVLTSWEGTMLYNYSPMIYAYNCNNIGITGEGTVDGEGHKTWNAFKAKETEGKKRSREMNHNNVPVTDRKFGEGYYLRPQLIQFFNCSKILIENIKIEDSPFWCLHLLKSKNITVRGLAYQSHNYNNDGIDPEYSENVLIENITFDNADDNIAIKSGRDHEGRANSATPSQNIVIRNCKFKGLHGVVLGSEMSAGIQNIYVENCKTTGYLKRGIYLKTNADRGGFIKNIFVRNIQLDEVEDCLYITSNYHGEGKGFPSNISNVFFSDITCNKASQAGIVIQGYPELKIKNIYLNNITITSAKNAISNTNAENVVLNEVIIGEKASTPSSVKMTH